MAEIFLSPKSVLRHDPYYFDSYSLFDTVSQTLFPLDQVQYELIDVVSRYGLDEHLAERFFLSSSQGESEAGEDDWRQLKRLCMTPRPERTSLTAPLPPVTFPTSPSDAGVTTSPTFVDLCLTRRCNLACVHCNVSAHSLRPKEKSTCTFWKETIDELVAHKVLKIILTGGEPLLYREWSDLYGHICSQPLAVSILTNGTTLDPETIARAKENGHNFAISLDGATSDVHDDFRRWPGAFDATLRGLADLRDAGVVFTLTVTLHRHNLPQIERFIALAEQFGATGICFNAINDVGRGGSAYAQRYYPTKSEIKAAFDLAKRVALHGSSTEIVMGDFEEREYNHISSKISGSTQMSRRNPGLCKAGIYALSVDEDGSVYSCLRGLQARVSPIGNLKTQSLSDLWLSRGWGDFRNLGLPRVPCRIEEIESRQKRSTDAGLLHRSGTA